jgi:hypothetical protein
MRVGKKKKGVETFLLAFACCSHGIFKCGLSGWALVKIVNRANKSWSPIAYRPSPIAHRPWPMAVINK